MPNRPLAVLIADDSPAVADMLAELISDPGRIEVVGTAGTQEAVIEAVRRLRPDVVLLDLQLKTGSGTEVIRAVRSSPELAGVRILVMSNHTSPHLKAGCLELGARAYFDKVKELAQLSAELAQLADEKKG